MVNLKKKFYKFQAIWYINEDSTIYYLQHISLLILLINK